MPAILSPVVLQLNFAAGGVARQSVPIFCPEDTEITTTIAAINGIVQGSVSLDYTNSGALAVANGTATFINGAVLHNTAGIFTDKIYANCYVRVNCVSGTATVTVNPVGNTLTPPNNPFLPYINTAPAPPPAATSIISATPGLITDNSPAWAAQCADSGTLVPLTTNARFATPGDYLFNALNDLFPSLSIPMWCRGGIRYIAGSNLPAVTSAPGAGAEAALIRVLARTPPTPDIQAFETDIGGFNIDFSHGTQTNFVCGIRMPNPNPANNPFDPDPNFNTNKDYTAGYIHDMDIEKSSGHALHDEGGRGRLSLFNVRALDSGFDGFHITGNDTVAGGHWAAGGNGGLGQGGFGVHKGHATGLYAGTANFWSSPQNRAVDSGSVWMDGAAYWVLFANEFNDWLRASGSVNWNNPGLMAINQMHPHSANFQSDGVAYNRLNDGDPRLQAHSGFEEYQGLGIIFNAVTRSDVFSGATPGNFNGLLDGTAGTVYQHVWDFSTASSNGEGPGSFNVVDQWSTEPNRRPWTSLAQTVAGVTVANPGVFNVVAHGLQPNSKVGFYTTGTPPTGLVTTTQIYFVSSVIDADHFTIALGPTRANPANAPIAITGAGSPGTFTMYNLSTHPYAQGHANEVNYLYMDAVRGLIRTGGLGPTHAHFAMGLNESDDINPSFNNEFGDRTGASRSAFYDQVEFHNVLGYLDEATTTTPVTDGGTRNVAAGDWLNFFTSPPGINSFNINLPTDLPQSQEKLFIFVANPIPLINWGVNGSGSIGGLFTPPPATSSDGPMVVRALYKHQQNAWYFTQAISGDVPSILGRIDGLAVRGGLLGEQQRVNRTPAAGATMTSGSAISFGGGTGLTLPPGVWDIYFAAQWSCTSGSLTGVTELQWGISTTQNLLPVVQDEAFGQDILALGTVGATMFASRMAHKPGVSISVSTNYFPVQSATFTGTGTVKCSGTIWAKRTG